MVTKDSWSPIKYFYYFSEINTCCTAISTLYLSTSYYAPLLDLRGTIHSTQVLWLKHNTSTHPISCTYSEHPLPLPTKLQHADISNKPTVCLPTRWLLDGKANHQTIHHPMCLGESHSMLQTNSWSQTRLNKSLDWPLTRLYRPSKNTHQPDK